MAWQKTQLLVDESRTGAVPGRLGWRAPGWAGRVAVVLEGMDFPRCLALHAVGGGHSVDQVRHMGKR